MSEKIGKYRIIERIGRGGMGMIFKAHDPILDRLVALKVISPEVEVTDELRTRFFREAQACAKLNHPNIVTIYDMGENEGSLFIVMELLEGQELRRFIAPGTPLTLEDKLSVMTQVCGGLHYAHQMGIVHRDMKPGNVFVLGNGRVKILDFGIAHMTTTNDGLTRTGLIMGTLRYISPEQLQGRADHRSDMFSVGSVFYELLTLRPPFTGDDPMHLLEQLRSAEPPPASEIDTSIPPTLTSIVQRAIRKNPAERFRDLEEMRAELEQVQRGVTEERYRVSARVRGQRERLGQLQGELAERLGAPGKHDEIPPVDERKGLAVIQALERTLAERIGELEGKIAEADAVMPTVQRAEALRRGAELGEKARSALRDRRYVLCLEILEQALELALPTDLVEELASLRDRALAEQQALRRATQEADEASKQCEAARRAARAEDAAQYAPESWNEAQAMMGAAEASVRRDAYDEAKADYDRAGAAYQRAQAAAGQARVEERRAAEGVRGAATQEQQQARAVDAAQYARDLWEAAEAKFGEGQAAYAKPTAGHGRARFTEASGLYRRAESAARDARGRERQRAEAARERAAEGRRSAASLDAEHQAASIWAEAIGRSAAGEAAWLRQQYPRATDAFEAALGLYHQAHAQVRELGRRQPGGGERKQATVVVDPPEATVPARTPTFVDTGPSSLSAPGVEDTVTTRMPAAIPEPDTWEAPEPWRGGPLALVGGFIGLAAIIIVVVAVHRREPIAPPMPPARGAPSARVAEERRNTEPAARDDAPRVSVEQPAGTDADRQLPPRSDPGAIRSGVAPKLDGTPRRPPAEVERTEPARTASTSGQEVTILAARVQSARRAAEQAAAGYWVPQSFASAQGKEQLAGTARERSDYAAAVKLLGEAESEYRSAAQQAKIDAEAESKIAPLTERVKESRASTVARRTEAVTAQAGRFAKDAFDAAEATHREADALDRRQAFATAAKAYESAAAQYRDAARRAQAVRESRPADESPRVP